MMALPEAVAGTNAWQHAARLAMAVRSDPEAGAIGELTAQLELALFLTFRSELSTPKRPPAPSVRRRSAARRRV